MAELIPGGSKVRVTNDTKLRYLDALAQHRLASSIRNEVDHFLRGLNELIPDNLLGIFDENELEVRKIWYIKISLSDGTLRLCLFRSCCCAEPASTA